jgi:ribosomal protein S12 methylthiotransferase accessory factor
VYHVLLHLEKKGYLAKGNGQVADEQKAFWHIQDIDPATAAGRLAETGVSVISLGCLEVGPLLAALHALHVNGIDSLRGSMSARSASGLLCVVTDDYLRAGLETYNQEALSSGRPWLLVKPVGCQIWIGPLFQPGKTGCWECLAQRLRANREAEVYVQDKKCRADPLPIPRTDTPATRAIAWNLAATEIAQWIARGRSPCSRHAPRDEPPHAERDGNFGLKGKVLTLDVLTWKTQTHTLVRRPQCPACGNPDQRRDPAIILESRKKTFTQDGGHRAISPEETLRRHEHHVSRITGPVTMLQRCSWSGDGVVHVYGAGHNFAQRQGSLADIRRGLRSQSSGKGTSDLQAKASGLCEALERYCGVYRGNEPRIAPCRLRDLGDAALHPNLCMQYSDKQYRERDAWNARKSNWNSVPEPFDEDRIVEWTPVWSLTRQEVRYLPTAFCYYDYPQEPPYCFACSNGNAAGNTLEEAILQGFFELVERDAAALWWYNRVRRPAVDLDRFDEPYLRQLARYLRERQHRDLWVLDLTSDLQVPAFAAVSRRTDRQPEEILTGLGCHFDARIALLRAVTELNQMLSWVMSDSGDKPLAQDTLDDPETRDWLRTATLENQHYLVPADAPLRVLADYSHCQTDDLRDDVLACQALVERQGLEMLVLDQTRPDIGLPVVKVIVPGLRHFWARYAPGRLYDVPVQLGWLPQPPREDDLNPIPLFL